MKILRWIICFPTAAILSIAAWFALQTIDHHVSFGGGFLYSVYGLMPLILDAAIPTIVFSVVGVWTSPSSERTVAFVFFPLSILFSGGGMEMLRYSWSGGLVFWLTATMAIVAGALVGLSGSLWILNRRSMAHPFSARPTIALTS